MAFEGDKLGQGKRRIKLSTASKIVIFYVIIGGGGIWFLDGMVSWWVKDYQQLVFYQNYKIWVFIGITALLLYWLLNHYLYQLKIPLREVNKFHTLIEFANDAIFFMKGDTFIECNSKTLEIFGLKDKEDIVGKTPYFFSPEKQPNGRFSKEKAREFISAAQKGIPQFFEWQHCKLDGTLIDTEVSLNCLPLPNQEVIIAIVRDISERKRAEAEIKRLNQELEQRVVEKTRELEIRNRDLEQNQQILLKLVRELNNKTAELQKANLRLEELDRLKSMFIASMSHELRTPLNSIIGFSSIVLEEWAGPLNAEQKENLSIILKSGKHLLSLINEVIDISKIEAGLIEPEISVFDSYDLITEAVKSFAPEIEKKRLEFPVALIHQEMHTDRRRLLQCVMNLLSNAVKFTERGRISLKANLITFSDFGKTTTGQVLNFLEITVEDTGIGIQEKDLAKLFQPFVRIDSPLKSKVLGSGLGLYLTKKIATEILKGGIEVSSKPGQGSIFTLRIPIRI